VAEGDNVSTLGNEFPSNLYPWMNLAAVASQPAVCLLRVAGRERARNPGRLRRRTRIISVSWVGYATGWRMDVSELVESAHDRGLLVFLDTIQGLGLLPLDVRATGVDFLAADGHKWMLGPRARACSFFGGSTWTCCGP